MKRLLLIAVVLLAGCSLPPPGGAPVPPAPNVVTAECLDIITIDDATTRTVAQGQLLGDKGYWDGLKKSCHSPFHLDSSQIGPSDYAVQIRNAGGLPCIIFADHKTHKELGSLKLPETQMSIDALVKKYTGK